MNCEEFKKHIDNYFLDPDFDWKLRYDMDDHLIECEQCQKIYSLSSLVTSKEVMSEPIKNVKFEMLYEKAELYMKKDKYKEAIKYLKEALELKPENKEVPKKLNESRKLLKRRFAHRFIQKFYPSEINLFDIAWRVFEDLRAEDFKQEAVSGALGIVGTESSDLKTPQVIVFLNELSHEDIETMPIEKIKENLTKISQEAGFSQELANQIIDFICKG